MLVLTALVITLLILLLGVYIRNKLRDPGIPLMDDCWPIIGHLHLLHGDNINLYKTIQKISNAAIQNGGIVGVSFGITTTYFVTDPDDSAAIFTSSTEKHYMYYFAKSWLGNGLLTADSEKWHVNKKLLYPMFQQQNLNKFLTVFNKQGRRLVKQFSEHVGKGAFDHEHCVLITSLETICQTALGLNVGEQMARNKKYVKSMQNLMDIVVSRFKKVWFHFDAVFNLSMSRKEHDQHLEVVNSLTSELIQKRETKLESELHHTKNSEDFSPFIDTIIRISSQTKNFHAQQILDEINTLIVAGYDTAANALIFALMLLGQYQDIQDKTFKEIQEVFGDSDRDVDKYDITKLLYLDAVLKETLRLYTLTPFIGRKVTTEVKLKNYTIPAGVDCFLSLYGLHRNPEWGVDAEVFNPDRWMNPETIPKNPNLYAPFGMGKRYCVGKTYAMMSLKTTLVHVLRHYCIKCDMDKLVHQIVVLLKPASGQHIILERRNSTL